MPDRPKLDLTIAVATRNRAGYLRQLLASLESIEKPPALDYEVLLILNACTDSSREVAQSFQDRLPVRIIEEPRIGVSSARNAAIDAAQGEVIAWLDDDVVIEPGWFHGYMNAFRTHGDVGIFGGAIEPLFEGEVAPWCEKTWPMFSDVFAVRRPPADAPIDPQDLPYGANFAVRTELQRCFRFDEKLGRRGTYLIHGMEETNMVKQMLASGARGRWTPDARVQHAAPAYRRTRRYLFRYYAGYGFYLGQEDRREGRRLFDGRLLLATFRHAIKFGMESARGRPEQWVPAFKNMSMDVGRLLGRASRASEDASTKQVDSREGAR